MATVNGYGELVAGGVHEQVWTPITSGDVGNALTASQYPTKTVEVSGDFGGGSTLVIQGSNDGTGWHTLTDPQGNALSFAANGLETIQENPKQIRPNCTAGAADTSLTVRIISQSER